MQTVGQSNFYDRSFETNDEISLPFADATLTARLDAIIEKYARRADEIQLDAWMCRVNWHKLKDNALYLLKELL